MLIDTKRIVSAWSGLMVLTVLAVLVGRAHLGGWGAVLSLVVASVKALIVVGVFMRLAQGPNSPRLVLATAVVMLGLLTSLVVLDVTTRPSPGLVPPDVRPMSPAVGGGDQPAGSGVPDSRSPRMSSR